MFIMHFSKNFVQNKFFSNEVFFLQRIILSWMRYKDADMSHKCVTTCKNPLNLKETGVNVLVVPKF